MSKDDLQEIWEKQGSTPAMTKADIQAILQPQAKKNAFGLTALLWTWDSVIAGTLVVEGMNVYGLRANPVMLTIQIVLTLLTLMFLGYGIHLIGEMAALDRTADTLVETVRQRLHFYRTKFEIWLWMVAITLFFLSFAVVTMRHNRDGSGHIDRSGFDMIDAAVSVIYVLAAYSLLKLGSYPFVRELKAILSDLEHQITSETDQIRVVRNTWLRWLVVAGVLGTIVLVWLILRMMGVFG